MTNNILLIDIIDEGAIYFYVAYMFCVIKTRNVLQGYFFTHTRSRNGPSNTFYIQVLSVNVPQIRTALS